MTRDFYENPIAYSLFLMHVEDMLRMAILSLYNPNLCSEASSTLSHISNK